MNIQAWDLGGGVNIQPVKTYTQGEVDDLLETKAIEDEIQAADRQKRLDNKTVANLVRKSNRILVSISTHGLPFDFFPNTINIEEGRVTIINRHLFSSEIHSVDIKNISNIFINRTALFSQLVIISKTFEENEIKIKNLRTKEAVYIRRIIEGLRIFESKQIDTANYTKAELISKLEQLSTTKIVV